MNLRLVSMRGLTATAIMFCAMLYSALSAAQNAPTLLLRQPSVSREHIAFVHAGDIWVANRSGQNPVRLTAHPADEFSPVH